MSSDKDNQKPVAVVMTTYNAMPVLELAVDSFLKSTDYPFEMILVESESTDGTAERCDRYAKEDKRIRVIHTKKGGVSKASNDGIKEAGDLDVLLTQSDVIFPKKYKDDWLEEMVTVSKLENCGLVTCYGGSNISGPDYVDKLNYVGTWCMFLPRTTINKIGVFDLIYGGPGDDIDYSYRVYLSGLHTNLVNYWVDHHQKHSWRGSPEHDAKFLPLQETNGQKFREKYGLDILEVTLEGTKRYFSKTALIKGGYRASELNHINHDVEVFATIVKTVKDFNDDDVYIDVGAGTGDTSIWHDKGTCYAFEPSRSYPDLLKHIKMNSSNTMPINSAVYSKPIHYEIVEGEHFGFDELKESDDETKPQAIVLDEKFKNTKNIKLIKIDVESGSFEALKGAIEIIKKHKPVIIIEVDHVDTKAVEVLLQGLDYDTILSKDGITCIGTPKEIKNEKDTI